MDSQTFLLNLIISIYHGFFGGYFNTEKKNKLERLTHSRDDLHHVASNAAYFQI
jgi:hypothetical protein